MPRHPAVFAQLGDGAATLVDVSGLRADRFETGDLVVERNVA